MYYDTPRRSESRWRSGATIRQFRMRVRDDGKGINPKLLAHNRHARHFGLRDMRERAKLVGGRLDERSELDSGTEIELTIPAAVAYRASSDLRSGPSGSETGP
jgi:nitrate/nitrite-specific signal transduction histidine kinase